VIAAALIALIAFEHGPEAALPIVDALAHKAQVSHMWSAKNILVADLAPAIDRDPALHEIAVKGAGSRDLQVHSDFTVLGDVRPGGEIAVELAGDKRGLQRELVNRDLQLNSHIPRWRGSVILKGHANKALLRMGIDGGKILGLTLKQVHSLRIQVSPQLAPRSLSRFVKGPQQEAGAENRDQQRKYGEAGVHARHAIRLSYLIDGGPLGAKVSIFVVVRVLAIWLIWFGWRLRNAVDANARLTGGLITVAAVLLLPSRARAPQ
jgi:hypothetical protein